LEIVPLFQISATINFYPDESILSNLSSLANQSDIFQAWWYPSLGQVITYTGNYVAPSSVNEGVWSLIPNETAIAATLARDLFEDPGSWPLFEAIAAGQMHNAPIASLIDSLVRPPFLSANGGSSYSRTATGYPSRMLVNTPSPQGRPWNVIQTYELGVGIPLQSISQAVTTIQNIRSVTPFYLPLIGIYFRFAPASTIPMAIENGRQTVHIDWEIPGLGLPEPAYLSAFVQQMTENLDGRLHWGKNLQTDWEASYSYTQPWSAMASFFDYVAQVDPNGYFDNSFYSIVSSLITPVK